MSTRTQERPPFEADYDDVQRGLAGVGANSQLVPIQKGDTSVSVMGEIVTAQRVAVPRDLARIRNDIKALAAMSGARWVYRIPFKNRKTNQTDYVEGPTIKCANAIVRAYGNCLTTCRVFDEGDHWMIYARVVDLQSGATYDRPYQQRKGQDTGMRDAARQLDMVFQIGVSKATRNVVVNFLDDLVAYAVEEAKAGILERVNKNPKGAKDWIVKQLGDLEIEVKRVERVYGRVMDHWTVPDMAKMFAEINSIIDGMADAEDVYPSKGGSEEEPEPQSQPQGSNKDAATKANKALGAGQFAQQAAKDDTAETNPAAQQQEPPAGEKEKKAPAKKLFGED